MAAHIFEPDHPMADVSLNVKLCMKRKIASAGHDSELFLLSLFSLIISLFIAMQLKIFKDGCHMLKQAILSNHAN